MVYRPIDKARSIDRHDLKLYSLLNKEYLSAKHDASMPTNSLCPFHDGVGCFCQAMVSSFSIFKPFCLDVSYCNFVLD